MQPTSFRALAGWTSCLPLGVDAIKLRRTFDTASLASAFPFTSPDLSPIDPTDTSAPDGILYGVNAASSGLVIYDRWAQDNYNSIVLARSGQRLLLQAGDPALAVPRRAGADRRPGEQLSAWPPSSAGHTWTSALPGCG